MARAIGRAKSRIWWLVGFLCAFLFRAGEARPQAVQDKYGVPERPGARKDIALPPASGAPSREPLPPGFVDPGALRPADDPANRADAERLLKRYEEPVKAVEPTAKESEEAKSLAERLLKSAADAEAHAKAGRTEEAKKANDERLKAFEGISALGPAALGLLRERVEALSKDASASEFVRSQPRLAIRRIESDARKALEPKIARLGQGALEAIRPRIEAAADAVKDARERVGDWERRLSAAADDKKEGIRRSLAAAREELAAAQILRERLQALDAKTREELAKRPAPPRALRPPTPDDRDIALYGVRERP